MTDSDARFTEACRLRDESRAREAVEAYGAIIHDPESGRRLVIASHIQAGGILRGLCSYDAAEAHARRAVDLAPKNQLASLLLFHVLLSTAEAMAALQEMLRFVKIKDSPMYRDLLVGEFDLSPMGAEYGAAVDQARAELARWRAT